MRIHQIDLHYHSGQERAPEKSLADHIDYARITGRKILGVTDHINLYAPSDKEKTCRYPRTTAGLLQYRREFDVQKKKYPDMRLFFAPELTCHYDFTSMDSEIINVSDYFICEPPAPNGDTAENTARMAGYFDYIGDIKRHTGRPVFMAHPFRPALARRVRDRYIEKNCARLQALRWNELPEDDICGFLALDLGVFASQAVKTGIPVEINGNTQSRARGLNIPLYLAFIWGAYAALKRRGVTFVPSSDQHDFTLCKHGGPVPEDCFEALGIGIGDIAFLKELGIVPT